MQTQDGELVKPQDQGLEGTVEALSRDPLARSLTVSLGFVLCLGSLTISRAKELSWSLRCYYRNHALATQAYMPWRLWFHDRPRSTQGQGRLGSPPWASS